MPDRLDQISVTTSGGLVSLRWGSRNKAPRLDPHLESAAGIVKAFTHVGASRPVTLSEEDRALLCELLQAWSMRVGAEELPAGVWDLRCAIADDLHDDPAR